MEKRKISLGRGVEIKPIKKPDSAPATPQLSDAQWERKLLFANKTIHTFEQLGNTRMIEIEKANRDDIINHISAKRKKNLNLSLS